MRRLTIGWGGVSTALGTVRQVLEQYGHRSGDEMTDLVIEDGSQPLPLHLHEPPRISLRLGIGPVGDNGLPALQLRGYENNRRLIAAIDLAEEPSGNGQRLRRQATNALLEWVALHVSSLARDPGHLASEACANTWPEQGLQALETLAYLHRFNRTAAPALLQAAQVPMIERLRASLLAFAERPALNIAGNVVTYRQLQVRASAIQQQLGPLLESRAAPAVVGVCLEKSTALYASILAVLGCGAVYLPLTSDHPPQRQQAMLESAGAQVLLDDGQHPLRERFVALDVSTVSQPDTSHPLGVRHPDIHAPCMVLFTSGTTGRPKGVLLSQGNLAHFTAWFGSCMELSEQSRVLQFASLNFDASLMDIFPGLIAGAQLFVPSEAQRRDPQQLVELIRQERISHAFLPPALLSILPLARPLGLSHLLTGGDACEPYVIEQLAGQCQLHNLYGPTEATVLVTHRTLQPADGNRNLGRPIANSQVLILDEHLQPVDEQVMGELYIVGPGVGLGYLDATQTHDDPFVELALPSGQTLRAYRSGDLAKWTADGIELGGRRDAQVKIRGVRVEPQEIEECLRNSRLFRQVAVVIDGERRIRSIVAQPEPGATMADLKQHAQQWLPDYLQPDVWTELPNLPYSSNGKIDRQALLALPVQPASNTKGQAAQTPLQMQLAELWSELLRLPVEAFSMDDSFFNLGGHSILLSTLLLRMREQLGRSLPLNRFFEMPTIRTLALLMEDAVLPDAPCGQAVRDALRDPMIEVLSDERVGDPRKVIVTGANSFIGVHIVEALLAGGATEVACLVRELPGQPAATRFAQALSEYRLEHLDLSRVQVYAADISRPRLGLTGEVYESLARDYGALVHNAAQVNHVMDYASLAKHNVEPVLECLRLCETRCKKVLNFISTLSACSSIDARGHVLETPAAATPPIYLKNGYNLSKWVAERLLAHATTQGAWVNIHRPGNISFNSRNGVCQPQKNRLMLMLKGSLQLGLVPRLEVNFDLMPVDFFAQFLAFHCGRFDAGLNVFNLHNPQPLSWDHYLDVFSQVGYRFERVSVAHWQRALRTVGPENALFGVLGFYLEGLDEDIGDTSMIRHDNARAGIEKMGTQYPDKNSALLRKGCDYLKAIGFL
ncbi:MULTISPECIES: amino acid adenylation domain-containing protein [unclassified Pseudomonas]|jgi:amino acid adenylation domain-containing protein/thioester reductase-like protein|uniref:Peptide transporter n=1 Tax=Pseudomonas gorinensis TaxID=3240790 RepID=A0ACA7NYI4_9PSED|nr:MULTISPECIES: amino acid adenylation domain-containing protein [unclassified Pseudomonas]AHC32730.1 peptide transporter [Pseudomonas sp. TKP]MBL1307412.1 non-ribosomal peptide synthetase [Pseudomonas sp.]PMX02242.1 peptide transporter [Pseudomonas sp. MPBC4-3]PMX39365.1 peptide transporter [Pseudomonas sp. FW301-21B01]PMY01868.1 peptide transporter [Pseudomonas sp. MPR-R5A]